MIYFIACPDANAVKIGVVGNSSTERVFMRLRGIQTCCPLAVQVLGVDLDGHYQEEGELHRRFAADRIRGEWFTLTDEVRAHISQFDIPERQWLRPPRATTGLS